MLHRQARLVLAVGAWLIGGRAARAQDAGTTTPTGADFTFALSRLDSGGNAVALDTSGLATLLNTTRCACPQSVVATVALSNDGAAAIGDATVQGTLAVGNDCNNVAATGCTNIGAVFTLSAGTTTTSQTFSTSDLFRAAVGNTACASLPATSTNLWAILRINGARLDAAPTLALTVGAKPPAAPTAVTTETADGALLVTWAPGDSAPLSGYQVLCAPGIAAPPAPAYATCAAAALPAGTADAGTADAGGDDAAPAVSPFATVNADALCSGLVGSGTSTRVRGLENGRTYLVAVIAIGSDGTPSAPSGAATGVPGPTLGFADVYKGAGGTASGCAVGGGARGSLAAALAVAAIAFARRRRRRGRRLARGVGAPTSLPALLIAGSLLCAAAPARAQMSDADFYALTGRGAAVPESPREWNLELRFGPYRPDVDAEFAARGSPERPYAETFGDKRRLMTQLEIDRQLSHRRGTWAVGVVAGYSNASAASLAADHVTRTGDQTSLRLIPLSLVGVYRADWLLTRYGVPLIPYAKLGLDCTLWSSSDTARGQTLQGYTLGWHAAAGAALVLDFIDPEGARTMDHDSGINHTAIFFEGTHDALDGTGNQLHVGDTTWMAGVMFEM